MGVWEQARIESSATLMRLSQVAGAKDNAGDYTDAVTATTALSQVS